MDRHLDPHLQRIIDNAVGTSDCSFQDQEVICSPEEQRSVGWSFGPRPRQPPQEPVSFNEFGRALFDTPDYAQQGLFTGTNRITLTPRNIYNQTDQEHRSLSNADNHFRFTQNLREGMPINHPVPQRLNAIRPSGSVGLRGNALLSQQSTKSHSVDPIDQLANAMLMKKSIPPSQLQPEPANSFQVLHPNRIKQLQPQTQQRTPFFNLAGFTYSPSAQASPESSSPPAAQGSSPTARVSIRRAANRTIPHSTYPQIEDYYEDPPFPETTLREHYTAPKRIPQTLALGHDPPVAHGIQLISPHQLPDRFRQVFPYELFNAVQSKCFAAIYRTNDNVVVSAPTGSGKTALFELAICKLVEGQNSGQFKIIYQAPTKSLCAERMRDWQKKFSHLNLHCAELTGDTNQADMARVKAASIIVTTPEKWDSITRKWADHHKLVHLVKLFLIDEVHILNDIRGATLEAVVSRMKTMGADVRFVALSATVPNSHDIAIWLGRDHTSQTLPAHRETFGEDFRPVKLQKHVYGYDGLMNDFAFDKVLDGKLPSLIQKHTHKKPIMIFCFTRKSVESTATMLAEWWTGQRVVDRAWPAPLQRTVVGSKELQQLVACGVAFHHAGLNPQDRHAIETAYLKGDISLICCTSTLAVGVNLPCHLVVLKGTVGFQDGQLVEYSDLEVMQMLGRAGRPQFDNCAVAVIMTRSDKTERYKKMVSGQDVLESTLHLNLIEHLNSEISLGSVKDLQGAKRWIFGTFLNVRMRQNPNYYKINGVDSNGDTEQRLELVCERDIKLLQEQNLITDAEKFSCTEYGEAMSRYMIKFDTMKLLLSIPSQAKAEQILHTICQAAEFKDLRMRPQERPFLREFNKSPFIKFPIKEAVSTTAHKISLMIQIQLGGCEHPTDKEFAVVRRQFITDKGIIFDRVHRLIRCVIDCKAYDCDAISTRHALDLGRSLIAEYWENSNLQLRQIPQIGPAAVRKLVSNDVNSIEMLMKKDTATIERIMSKNPPYGRKMKDFLLAFPCLSLTSEILGRAPSKPGQKPKVTVKAVLGYENDKIPVWKGKKPSVTFMAETTHGKIAYIWRGNIMKLEKGCELKFTAELSGPDEKINCWVACEEIVGTVRSCMLMHNIPASAFPAPVPHPKASADPITTEKKISLDNDRDEFGGDELDDDDILAVVKSIEPAQGDYDSEEFEDIDDVGDSKPENPKKGRKSDVFVPPVQMANGKWTCSHSCADGKVLKNGKPCKHRCCHEGLDRPRRPKKTIDSTSIYGANSRIIDTSSQPKVANSAVTQKPKTVKNPSRFNVKLHDETFSDSGDVEIVDLAQDVEPITYADLAPRDYRKLHNLHTSVQSDKAIRLTKKKPQFSYANGEKPNLPFLHNDAIMASVFDFAGSEEDEDFPTPSALGSTAFARKPSPESFEFFAPEYEQSSPSSFLDDRLETLEAGKLKLAETGNVDATSPNVDSSFANGIFDFDAFNDRIETPRKPETSPLKPEILKNEPCSTGAKNSLKRDRSATPELLDVKHRRVAKDEHVSQVTQATIPDWVNDFDSELIDELRGYVDFVD